MLFRKRTKLVTEKVANLKLKLLLKAVISLCSLPWEVGLSTWFSSHLLGESVLILFSRNMSCFKTSVLLIDIALAGL